MADVWANSKACNPRATYHIAGCCHLVNWLSRFQSHMPHCRVHRLTKSMSWSCHIAGCKNSIRHNENRFSRYYIFFLFLMQFKLWRAAAFVSSQLFYCGLIIILLLTTRSLGRVHQPLFSASHVRHAQKQLLYHQPPARPKAQLYPVRSLSWSCVENFIPLW